MLSGPSRDDLYTPTFVKTIDDIKSKYNRGDDDSALIDLNSMNEESLLPAEKALRRNLIGVIFFSKDNFEQAAFQFNQGLANSSQDKNLTAQINLNLSSSYFKLGMNDRAYESLKVTEFQNLKDRDFISYHKLRYHLAQETGHQEDVMISLFYALSAKKNVSELKSDPLYEVLNDKFSSLSSDEKNNLLRKLEDEKSLVAGYFAFIEAEKRHYSGNKEGAQSLLEWLKAEYSDNAEIKELISHFGYRLENDIKMEPNTIGVILPLSGKKKRYGERALLGLDSRIRQANKEMGDNPIKNVYKKIIGSQLYNPLFKLN